MGAMSTWQPGILMPPTPAGRFLTFSLTKDARPRDVAARLAALPIDERIIAGVGAPLARALNAAIPGLHDFVEVRGAENAWFPSTQGALWFFLGGTDAGEILHRARRLVSAFGDWVRVDEDIPSFVYGGGRDLSGYEDGTENPKGENALTAAFGPAGPTRTGGCFVATQKWIHDLGGFERLSHEARNDIIGRDLDSNDELATAPMSAHVKRTAQESFDPPSFVLRRSMPWGDVREHGLYFVAYGATLDPFERILRRMAGLEDGTVDALLKLSRAVTGGAFWCPPVVQAGSETRLDLRALGV
jgi:putative iron-dependent peroxidase